MGCTASSNSAAAPASSPTEPPSCDASSAHAEANATSADASSEALSSEVSSSLKKKTENEIQQEYNMSPTNTSDPDISDNLIVGTATVPPPRGYAGRTCSAGSPSTNLKNMPGVVGDDGLIERELVVLKSGATYVGQWKEFQRDGLGTLLWPDGMTYKGAFILDVATGFGQLNDSKGNVYEGQFKDNKINGKGTFTHSDGSKYTGGWIDGIKDGSECEEIWADGTLYRGDFKNGDKHGNGSITFADTSTYTGEFVEDRFQGTGTYTWANGHTYTGEWEDGLLNGTGTYVWPSGQFLKYEGTYNMGIKHGSGKLYFRDGRIYEGPFCRNKQHGVGSEMWPGGKTRKGEWKDGKLFRWIDGQATIQVDIDETKEVHKSDLGIFSDPQKYFDKKVRKEHKLVEAGINLKKKDPPPNIPVDPEKNGKRNVENAADTTESEEVKSKEEE